MLFLVRHWWPEREIVADSGYAAITLLGRCARFSKPIAVITCLRLDAAIYEPAPPRRAGQIGRPRLRGKRLPNLAVVAEDPSIVWRPVAITDWYGVGECTPPGSSLIRRSGTIRGCHRYPPALGAGP